MKKTFIVIIACVAGMTFFSCGEPEDEKLTHITTDNEFFKTEEALVLNTEGVDLSKEGKYDEARKKLEEALAIEPDNATVLGNIGNVEMLAGDPDLAKTYFLRSIAADSTYFSSMISYASVLYDEDSLAESKKWNNRIIQNCTEDANLGLAHLRVAYVDFYNGVCDSSLYHYTLAMDHLKRAKVDLTAARNFEITLAGCH